MEVQLLTKRGKPYIPSKTQALWHASPAASKCLLGPFGEGKTTPLVFEVLLQALEVPDGKGFKGMLCRYDEKTLLSTTWADFLSVIPYEIKLRSRIRQRPYPQVFFPNGAEVRGMHQKNYEQLGSEEFSVQGMDECNDHGTDENWYLMMIARRRNPIGRQQILLVGNHGPRNWVWRYFFAHKEDRSFKKYDDHEGFQILVGENKHNDPGYLKMMYDTYPEEWMSRYLSGDFGVAEGQILTEFNPDIHWVAPFPVPDFWPRYRGLDPGINHPTCALWLTTDPEGNHIAYREYVKRGEAVHEHARAILTASLPEENQIHWTVIDPSARQRVSTGAVIQSTLQQYLEAGLHCYEGDNDVKASIFRLKQLLTPDPARRFPSWHHLAGQKGSPQLFISTACPYLKWEIENWKWKNVRPGQIDREKVHAENDDMVACLRYVTMRSPRSAEMPGVAVNPHQRIVDIVEEMARERQRQLGGREEWVGAERLFS